MLPISTYTRDTLFCVSNLLRMIIFKPLQMTSIAGTLITQERGIPGAREPGIALITEPGITLLLGPGITLLQKKARGMAWMCI